MVFCFCFFGVKFYFPFGSLDSKFQVLACALGSAGLLAPKQPLLEGKVVVQQGVVRLLSLPWCTPLPRDCEVGPPSLRRRGQAFQAEAPAGQGSGLGL